MAFELDPGYKTLISAIIFMILNVTIIVLLGLTILNSQMNAVDNLNNTPNCTSNPPIKEGACKTMDNIYINCKYEDGVDKHINNTLWCTAERIYVKN